jgi:hypothetical protein
VDPGFAAFDLGPRDEGTVDGVPLGFEILYFGERYSSVTVDNDGYVCFGAPDEEAPAATSFSNTTFTSKMLGPFVSDVDTSGPASGTVHYGSGMVDGHMAFGVNWPSVGYFNGHADRLNTFQLVIIDRSDVAVDAFDFEFNYQSVAWECGDRECDAANEERVTALVGYFDKTGRWLLPGSGEPGAFVDQNTLTGLIHGMRGGTIPGRYLFRVRQGVPDGFVAPVADAGAGEVGGTTTGCAITRMPTTSGPTAVLLGATIVALALARRRRRVAADSRAARSTTGPATATAEARSRRVRPPRARWPSRRRRPRAPHRSRAQRRARRGSRGQ